MHTNNLIQAKISRSALRHNAALLKQMAQPAKLCAMVKANAYGHGLTLVAQALNGLADAWGVAHLTEAVALREANIQGPILVFCPLDESLQSAKARQEAIDIVFKHSLEPVIHSADQLALLKKHAQVRQKTVNLHLKVDTGMGRAGSSPSELLSLANAAQDTPFLRLAGICSHFASADSGNLEMAHQQAEKFKGLTDAVKTNSAHPLTLHMANSAAVFNLPTTYFDMVRPGIALYGYYLEHMNGANQLKPVMEVDAPVIMLKNLPKGHSCGYDSTFIARSATKIGLISIGYADGYDRQLSNTGVVDFSGQYAPVIGRVSMDAITVNLNDLPQVQVGDRARIISSCKTAPNSINKIAKQLNTIPNEITCRLGIRVQRCLVS